jgi:hypothetical protein
LRTIGAYANGICTGCLGVLRKSLFISIVVHTDNPKDLSLEWHGNPPVPPQFAFNLSESQSNR